MPYVYRHFIPQNIAPAGATKIGVYDGNGNIVCSIPLGGLTQPTGEKLYSFCALSDVHITQDTAASDFERALTCAKGSCDFVCIAGDLVDSGSESQFATYKGVIDKVLPNGEIPVYAITGNHENYSTVSQSYLQNYTGFPLYYSFTKDDDVFIMVGHYGGDHNGNGDWRSNELVTAEELQWLYETLEANRNKRCFVFTHAYPKEDGVGNANGMHSVSNLWLTADGGVGQVFVSLLKHYKNTILFHGHSHFRFWLQEVDEKANYSSKAGYRSVHIPSMTVPRDYVDGVVTKVYAESEGYIVDVYDDYIILNGRDFIDNDKDGNVLPIATYKIDTDLVKIPAGTFKDSTGTIKT